MSDPTHKHDIYLMLADLFFLDTDPHINDYKRAAEILKANSWSKQDTLSILIVIAPIAGSNLGYLIYPVIGNWSGFDKHELCQKIEKSLYRRQSSPKWYFYLFDKYSMWMLKKLNVEDLLRLI